MAQNNINTVHSSQFLWVNNLGARCWVILTWGFLWAYHQMLAQEAVLWRLVGSWRIHFRGSSLAWLASGAGCRGSQFLAAWASLQGCLGVCSALCQQPAKHRIPELRALTPGVRKEAEALAPLTVGFRRHTLSLLQYWISRTGQPSSM